MKDYKDTIQAKPTVVCWLALQWRNPPFRIFLVCYVQGSTHWILEPLERWTIGVLSAEFVVFRIDSPPRPNLFLIQNRSFSVWKVQSSCIEAVVGISQGPRKRTLEFWTTYFHAGKIRTSETVIKTKAYSALGSSRIMSWRIVDVQMNVVTIHVATVRRINSKVDETKYWTIEIAT